ncbi:MAG: hypothetical protein NT154_10215, partial [Verrucomicrobia bacterium]|nr:hypothetical protein [Verrucomicrobiota bacterium]
MQTIKHNHSSQQALNYAITNLQLSRFMEDAICSQPSSLSLGRDCARKSNCDFGAGLFSNA